MHRLHDFPGADIKDPGENRPLAGLASQPHLRGNGGLNGDFPARSHGERRDTPFPSRRWHRGPNMSMKPVIDRDWRGRFRTSRLSWLSPAIRVMGGTSAVAQMFGRDRSTVRKWCTGEIPIPAPIANRLAERLWDLQSELTIVRADLLRRVKEGERRAAEGMARRREALGWAGIGRRARAVLR
jgi:hypothetical protein